MTQSVVAVSADLLQPNVLPELLDTLIFDANHCDAIFVEAVEHAYARIKQVKPDLVMVLFDVDDAAACQLLSMLKIDAELSGILLVTCASARIRRPSDDIPSELFGDSSTLAHAIPMN